MKISRQNSDNLTGTIFDIQHASVSDGDGVRTTVFLKGCPLRCLWCHNPESQAPGRQLLFYFFRCVGCGRCLDGCPARSHDGDGKILLDRGKCVLCGRCAEVCPKDANEICGRKATVREVVDEVLEDLPFYRNGGGMTVSGGEPASQPEFSLALAALAKENGVGTAIETSGYGPEDFFRSAAELGCTFLFDIKELDPDTHRRLTGVDNSLIMSNLRMLFGIGANVVLRLPFIPGANLSDRYLSDLGAFLAENKGNYLRAELIPYHRLGKSKEQALGRSGIESDPKEAKRFTAEFAEKIKAEHPDIDIRVI